MSHIGKIVAPRRILLLEDNPGDADLVTEYLETSTNAVLDHETRLEHALEAVHRNDYEVIVVDLTLPDAEGLDAVTRLGVAAPDAALVVLSGIESEDLAVEAVRCGAQDYLVKGDVTANSLQRALRYARERKLIERRLARMAHRDPLTGVANRRAMLEGVNNALARARRHRSRLALMFIDLDDFKPINDTHGHAVGDHVLRVIAERLEDAVRDYDTVARLGGDEFAVLLDTFTAETAPRVIAERVLASIARPMNIRGRTLSVSASIGVATITGAEISAEDFLRMADTAMYEAKAAGRGVVRVHGSRGAAAHAARS